MDDNETPTYNLQIEPQDGCHPGDGVSSTVTRLPSASDENENQLDGDGREGLSPGTHIMGKPEASEQDSLNNNESCTPSCEVAACENSADTPCESPKDGQASMGRDKKIPGKRSSRTKRGTTKKTAQGSLKILFYTLLYLKISCLMSRTLHTVLHLAYFS